MKNGSGVWRLVVVVALVVGASGDNLTKDERRFRGDLLRGGGRV